MGVSPIGLKRDLPMQASAERAAAKARKDVAPPAEAPGTRAEAVDLPMPLPGRLQLDRDQETGRIVGRIVDKESGRVIRQIPTEEALKLAAAVERSLEPLFSTEV